jgi:hypothetical protein
VAFMTIFFIMACAMCRSRQVTIRTCRMLDEHISRWCTQIPSSRWPFHDIDFTFLDVEYHPRTEPTTILAYLRRSTVRGLSRILADPILQRTDRYPVHPYDPLTYGSDLSLSTLVRDV